MSDTTTKFKVGDKISINGFITRVCEVFPDPSDDWYGWVAYWDDDCCVNYEWESCCQLVKD